MRLTTIGAVLASSVELVTDVMRSEMCHAARSPARKMPGSAAVRCSAGLAGSRPTPRLLFENKSVSGASAMVPKGENGAEKTPREQINVTLNWFEELKQRVPVK